MLVVLFKVSGSAYALPCRSVLEVVPLLPLREAPQAPDWFAGTFAYRGALVPVIDACQLLSGQPCAKRLSSRMALVRSSTQALGVVIVGVLAERMTEVRRLEGQTLLTHVPASEYLGSAIQEPSELVQVIDIDGLVGLTLRAEQRLPPVIGSERSHRVVGLELGPKVTEGTNP